MSDFTLGDAEQMIVDSMINSGRFKMVVDTCRDLDCNDESIDQIIQDYLDADASFCYIFDQLKKEIKDAKGITEKSAEQEAKEDLEEDLRNGF